MNLPPPQSPLNHTPRTTARGLLSSSRGGDSTTSLGNSFQEPDHSFSEKPSVPGLWLSERACSWCLEIRGGWWNKPASIRVTNVFPLCSPGKGKSLEMVLGHCGSAAFPGEFGSLGTVRIRLTWQWLQLELNLRWSLAFSSSITDHKSNPESLCRSDLLKFGKADRETCRSST